MLDTLLTFLALLSLCGFFAVQLKLNSAFAPVVAVSCVMLYFSLAGVIGIMVPAGWLFYVLCFALFAWAVVKQGYKNMAEKLYTPGFILFVSLSMVMLVYFAVRKPVFIAWDEFSLWGTASKLIKLNGSMYTTAEIGWAWTGTQRPGLIVLGYAVQFFGADFTPWKVYFGYNLINIACASALMANFRFKQWYYIVPLGSIGLMAPFFFYVNSRMSSLSYAYLTSYGDLAAGIMFGSVMAVYYGNRRDKTGAWPALVVLGAFALVKDNTLPVVLVAMGIIAFDSLVFCRQDKLGGKAPIPWIKAFGVAFAAIASVMAPLVIWSKHAAWANSLNPITKGQKTGASEMDAVVKTIRQLIGLETYEDKFSVMSSEFVRAFFNREPDGGRGLYGVSMAGSQFVTCILILLVFALAIAAAAKGRPRRRTVWAAVLSLGGFAGYMFVMLVAYSYLFKLNEGVTDFMRYMSSYNAGWFIMGVALVAQNGREHQTGWRPLAAKTGIIALSCFMALQFARLVPAGFSVLDYPDSVYAQRHREQALADSVRAQTSGKARIFFVSQGDDGQLWFRYSYFLLPDILDYSFGGGKTFGPEIENPPDHYKAVTPQEMRAELERTGCGYIFIEKIDEVFIKTYAEIFTDGLKDAKSPALYQRQDDGQFAPLPIKPQ